MEAYYAFVKRIIVSFQGAGLDYAFTGALAISYYGIPRTTSDIDVIVEVANKVYSKAKLASALHKANLIVNEREIDNALSSGFKIASFKDSISPYSLDVIFSNKKPEKRTGKIAGLETFFQSPEGLIAAKLRMIKATLPPERSAKDKKDIEAIIKFTRVDLLNIKKQAKKDKTLDVLNALGLNA